MNFINLNNVNIVKAICTGCLPVWFLVTHPLYVWRAERIFELNVSSSSWWIVSVTGALGISFSHLHKLVNDIKEDCWFGLTLSPPLKSAWMISTISLQFPSSRGAIASTKNFASLTVFNSPWNPNSSKKDQIIYYVIKTRQSSPSTRDRIHPRRLQNQPWSLYQVLEQFTKYQQ